MVLIIEEPIQAKVIRVKMNIEIKKGGLLPFMLSV